MASSTSSLLKELWKKHFSCSKINQTQWCGKYGVNPGNFSSWLNKNSRCPAADAAVLQFLSDLNVSESVITVFPSYQRASRATSSKQTKKANAKEFSASRRMTRRDVEGFLCGSYSLSSSAATSPGGLNSEQTPLSSFEEQLPAICYGSVEPTQFIAPSFSASPSLDGSDDSADDGEIDFGADLLCNLLFSSTTGLSSLHIQHPSHQQFMEAPILKL